MWELFYLLTLLALEMVKLQVAMILGHETFGWGNMNMGSSWCLALSSESWSECSLLQTFNTRAMLIAKQQWWMWRFQKRQQL